MVYAGTGVEDIMHTYMMTRGIKHDIDNFILQLQGKYLPFKWRDQNVPGSKVEDCFAQLAVRPVQLWEIVHPAGAEDIVLSTIFKVPPKPGERTGGMTQHKKHNKFIKIFRWILGIKEPKETWDTKQAMPICPTQAELIYLGRKDDYWVDKDGKSIDHYEEGAFEAL